jgi:hypothetical protein
MFLSAEGSSSINIARRAMSSARWGRGEPSPEPVDEAGGAKPQLNAGSLVLHGGVAHWRVRRELPFH